MNFIQLPKILLPELDFLNNILNCLYFAKYRAIDSFSVYFQIKALLKKKKKEEGFHFLLFYSVSGQEIVLLNYLFCGKTQFVGRSVQFSSVALSCLTLQPHEPQHSRPPCPSPTPGVHLNPCHWVGDAIQPSHPLSSPSSPALNLSQHQGLFKSVSSSHQVAKVGLSASTSVLPMNIQDWFPLGWTGWISLLSKGLFKRLLQHCSSKASILSL